MDFLAKNSEIIYVYIQMYYKQLIEEKFTKGEAVIASDFDCT